MSTPTVLDSSTGNVIIRIGFDRDSIMLTVEEVDDLIKDLIRVKEKIQNENR